MDNETDPIPWLICNDCGAKVVDMSTHLRFHRITHMQDEAGEMRAMRARRLGCVLIALVIIGAFLIGATIARYAL